MRKRPAESTRRTGIGSASDNAAVHVSAHLRCSARVDGSDSSANGDSAGNRRMHTVPVALYQLRAIAPVGEPCSAGTSVAIMRRRYWDRHSAPARTRQAVAAPTPRLRHDARTASARWQGSRESRTNSERAARLLRTRRAPLRADRTPTAQSPGCTMRMPVADRWPAKHGCVRWRHRTCRIDRARRRNNAMSARGRGVALTIAS